MRLWKPLPLWISVSLFALAGAMLPLIGQLRRGPAAPPITLKDLAARLSECTPSLHTVMLHQRLPEGPMWVCVRPQSPEYLQGLFCDASLVKAGQWRGIAFCQRDGEQSVILDDTIRHWGECGLRIGPFVFFGDPELLQRIRAEILDFLRE